MSVLLVTALCVLLLGFVNLAALLLARMRIHFSEMGLLSALGAQPARVARLVVIEAAVIGATSGVFGVLVAGWTIKALVTRLPPEASTSALANDPFRLGILTFLVSALGSIAFAMIPARRASRVEPATAMRKDSRAGQAFRAFGSYSLLAIQSALATILLIGAVVATARFKSLTDVALGFSAANVAIIEAAPPQATEGARFYSRLIEQLRQQPSVAAVGAGGSAPFDSVGADDRIIQNDQEIPVVHAFPGYFEVLGFRLRRGRFLEPNDRTATPDAAVLTESAARSLFGDRDPIGSSILTDAERSLLVVGVTSDVHRTFEESKPRVVYALAPAQLQRATLVVRFRRYNPQDLVQVRQTVMHATPGNPVTIRWMDSIIRSLPAYKDPQFRFFVLGGMGLLAIGLVASGVFALVSLLTDMRRREFAIRTSIGSTRFGLIRLALRRSLLPVVGGIALGGVGVLLTKRLLAALWGSELTIGAWESLLGALIVLLTALIAAYLPARRAALSDPVALLKW